MTGSAGGVLALTGGVGGAKLGLGLADCVAAQRLHFLVNTADDFEHLGLHISPDIDTLLYTLAGLSHPQQGWGLAGETFHALEALGRLGGDTWFRLGDRDLATHLWRSRRLAEGATLSGVTAELAAALGVGPGIHPMSDASVRTVVDTDDGPLPFQHYFVREQCAPSVSGFHFEGIELATPAERVAALLAGGDLAAIIVCPSNPYVSIDPVLQVSGVWEALRDSGAPVVLVSPIVAGRAIKGPTAKMMAELGVPVTAQGIAAHYSQRYPGLVDHFVIDESDGKLAADIADTGMAVAVAPTIMTTREDKQRLARFALDLAGA
jgi:LPPG:FO 2-phospho-L-lactate transferase